MELLVQLDPTLETPVVLVSLVFDVDGSPEVRRGVVDPFVPGAAGGAQRCSRSTSRCSWSRCPRKATNTLRPCTPRARATCARSWRSCSRARELEGELDRTRWEAARDLVLAAPPPWRDLTHPFQSDRLVDPPLTATEAAVLLDELGEWLAPERRARVQLALCVPDEVVDARYRTGIGHALDWGLSLTRELAARALELGIEKDEAALLVRRIEGLCRTSRETDLGGLGPAVLRAEWSDALEQAAPLGVSLTDDARELAQKHAGERALVHATALSDARDAALDPAREKARAEPPDRAALEELLTSGGYRDVLEACRLSHKLEPAEVGGLFARGRAARRSGGAGRAAELVVVFGAIAGAGRSGTGAGFPSRAQRSRRSGGARGARGGC